MKIKAYLLLFLFFFSLIKWTIGQTADITSGCLPLEVKFSPPSGVDFYFWDFKDGVTSNVANPVHLFVDQGTFEVEFRETINANLIGTILITVFGKPELQFAADTTIGCAPLDVNFKENILIDSAIDILEYQWVFGDGTTPDGSSNPNHTYTNGGNYDVSLSITTSVFNCNTTKIFPELIQVNSVPEVSFITDPDPAQSCNMPFEVTFTNTMLNADHLNFFWDFGNDNTSSQFQPDSQTYEEAGTHHVRLIATDSLGCTDTLKQIVKGPPIVAAQIPDTLCFGTLYEFINQSDSGGYIWLFGTGVVPYYSVSKNPKVVFETEGERTISLSVTDETGCQNSKDFPVFIHKPNAGFTTDVSFDCTDFSVEYLPDQIGGVSYNWLLGDSVLSMQQNASASFSFPTPDPYDETWPIPMLTTFIIESPSGCFDTLIKAAILQQPNARFIPDKIAGCAPLTITFSDRSVAHSEIIYYEYDYGDGNTNGFNSNANHNYTFTNPGEYNVVLNILTSQGCVDTSHTIQILVGDKLTPDFMVDKIEVCPGEVVHFTDITGSDLIDSWHYSSDGGRIFHCPEESELFYVYDDLTGPQDVTLSVIYNGCLSEITKEDFIDVKGPIAKIDYQMNCVAPYNVWFRDSSLDATSVLWDFGDMTFGTDSSILQTYPDTGKYQVVLTVENEDSGCLASTDTAVIFIREVMADFEIAPTVCKGGKLVVNAGASQGVNANCGRGYDWYFPVGRPITTQNDTVHQWFPISGIQTISLVVSDINGCKDTTHQMIKVYENNAHFTQDDGIICLPGKVNFQDISSSDTTLVDWQWNFGDGNKANTQHPSHVFETADSNFIPVTLTVTDVLGCQSITTNYLGIYTPVSTIIAIPSPPEICVGDNILFVATNYTLGGSHLTYSWDFGNDSTGVNQSNMITYNAPGIYEVRLDYEEFHSGCGGTTTKEVSVQDYPVAGFSTSVDGQDPICWPANILFTDESLSSDLLAYSWDFGNGQMSLEASPSANFGSGTFTIYMTVETSNGCSDTAMQTISLIGPQGNFIMDTDSICKGDEILFTMIDTMEVDSWTWFFGDGTTLENESPVTHAFDFFPPEGQTIARLELKGANGDCITPISLPVNIHLVQARFDTTDLCYRPYDFINLSTNADVFSWDFGDGNSSTEEDPLHEFETPGVYSVQLQIQNTDFGCEDVVVADIELFPLPEVITEEVSTCYDDPVIIGVANPDDLTNYFWTPEEFITDNNSPSVEVAPDETTLFQIYATNENNCIDTSELLLSVFNGIPDLENQQFVACRGELIPITLPVGENYAYHWSDTDGLSCINCSNLQLISENSKTYIITISDINGNCPSKSAVIDLIVPAESQFEIPNAFTPDGDQKNDYFHPVLKDEAVEVIYKIFQVYNRFGNLVYNNSHPNEGWDGLHKGKPAPSDVYFYKIIMSLNNCLDVEQRGDVLLIR